MIADLSLVSPSCMPRKYGLVLILVKLIVWHGYICICNPGATGVNCTTSIGCVDKPCQNNGTCNDTGSGYTCSCLSGFTGQNCTQETTVEFNGTTQWNLTSSVQHIEFSFRTTLKAGLILQLAGSNSNLFLSLGDQGLNLLNDSGLVHLSIYGAFSDGAWHNLSISVGGNLINVTTDGNRASKSVSISAITKYHLGSIQSSSEVIKTAVPAYIGCLKDLKIGGTFMIPHHNGSLFGGTVGTCTWQNLCSNPQNPCQNGGNCTDLWNDFGCVCPKGFSGKICSYTTCAGSPCSGGTSCVDVKSGNAACVVPYTLVESTSYIVFRNITASSYSSMQFSLLTQSSNGVVLASGTNSSHFLAIGLNKGKLDIVYRYWSMPSEQRVNGAIKINDGRWHAINITSLTGTSITVDSGIYAEHNAPILNSHFKTSVEEDGITVGNSLKPYLASLFNVSYYIGCFEKLLLGGDLLVQNTSMEVKAGCDACASNPCVRGACVNTSDGHRCACPQFYSGDNCNSTHNISCAFKSNLCHLSDCENLTVAVEPTYSQSGKDLFRCNCAKGYTGYLCDAIVDNCSPNPCVNGSCVSSIGNYTCNCISGFGGRNCSVNVNECNSNPCRNGGKCQDNVNGFVCSCTSGYKGDTCQISESDSSSNVGMWIGIGIAILVVILIILFFVARYCVGSSGLSGSYSPTGQEKGQVQMTSMPPIPPKERLI